MDVWKDTKIQKREVRVGAAADKFGGERGQEMEEVHTHGSLGFSFCEVIGGKIFVLRSHKARGVKGAAGRKEQL